MLYQLGALAIQVAPFNVDQVGRQMAADWAEKPVVGTEPPVEFVGAGARNLQLDGTLFPQKLGGLDELGQLEEMQASGLPQYLMRGDGVPLGWFVIVNVSDASTYLDAQGVGKVIKVSMNLRRARKPPDASFFSIVARLFG